MTPTQLILVSIVLPPALAVLLLLVPDRFRTLRESIAIIATFANLGLAISTFGQSVESSFPWLGTHIEFSLRIYHTASFIATAAAGFGLLVTLFSLPFMRKHKAHAGHYALMLISLGLANGVIFSNNLLLLLFFWEGLLGTTYGMIAIGNNSAFKTATKALVISGVTDLCLMLGIGFVWAQTHSLTMSTLHVPLEGLAPAAFVLLMIGAVSKGGSMPFHSWIPDAAVDAPMPFMAFLPASIEKLLGIYLLSRIALDWFAITPHSWMSTLLMGLGVTTMLLSALMSLVQDDYKRVLSFCAISQIGYMLVGIGSAVPIGIVGGLFHMINHAMYKSGLFFTGGAVEHATGSAKLSELGGLYRKMPVTFACFLITAASVAGMPPFNGFFSKELVYEGALESGTFYYLAAITGSFLTTAAFLRLGHAVFLGAPNASTRKVREAPVAMLVPMVVLSGACIYFGLQNAFPINRLITPMLPPRLLEEVAATGTHLSGWPASPTLVAMTGIVLLGAVINHWFGIKLNGGAVHATDHIHDSPGLKWLYEKADQRWFDPYELFMKASSVFAIAAYKADRANNWLVEGAGRLGLFTSKKVRTAHTGNTSSYIVWSLVAATLILFYLGQ